MFHSALIEAAYTHPHLIRSHFTAHLTCPLRHVTFTYHPLIRTSTSWAAQEADKAVNRDLDAQFSTFYEVFTHGSQGIYIRSVQTLSFINILLFLFRPDHDHLED